MALTTIKYNDTIVDTYNNVLPVNVVYKNTTLASMMPNTTKVLKCSSKLVEENIIVGARTLTTDDKITRTNIIINVADYIKLAIPTISTNHTYTGSTINPTITYDSANVTIVGGTTSATAVGTYSVTFRIKNKNDCCWVDGTQADKVISWSIITKKLTIPTLSGSYTYTGSAQSVTISNFNSTWETQSGTATATAVGTYTVTWALKDTTNTAWSDGTTGSKSASWSIATKKLTIPSASGTFTYDGASHSATISNFNSTWENQGGTATATNANTYTVTWTLKDTTNTAWSDNTTGTKSGTWTINKATLSTPSQNGSLTYNGSAQSPSWNNYDSSKMSVSGNSATNAGTYTATFTITNSNYKFSGGTTATASWSIGKSSAAQVSASPTSLTWSEDETGTKTSAITNPSGGSLSAASSGSTFTVSISGTTLSVTLGAAANAEETITITSAATTNYNASSCTVACSATKACLTGDTLIMLADYTEKKIKELTMDDDILVFNHETGKLDSAKMNFLEHDAVKEYNILNMEWSNGRTSRIIFDHGFFDMTTMKYEYIDIINYADYIGHTFYGYDGEYVTLVNAYPTREVSDCYSGPTIYHLNLFVDGILSMPSGIEGMFNIFECDEDLKYNEEQMAADIATYGLFDYANVADQVSRATFDSYPTKYLNVSIAKGLMTPEWLEYLIGRYAVPYGDNEDK